MSGCYIYYLRFPSVEGFHEDHRKNFCSLVSLSRWLKNLVNEEKRLDGQFGKNRGTTSLRSLGMSRFRVVVPLACAIG